jgi:hypothetical protein
MGIRKITAILVGLATCTAAVAQGSFNFDDIPGVDQAPLITLDVGPEMVAFFRNVSRGANPGAADIFSGLRGIKLRVYDASETSREFSSFIQETARTLDAQGWLRVASVQDESSSVQFHLRMTEEDVSGMTVMVMDGTEAIFITIDGSINAVELGRIMAQYGMQDLMGSMPSMPAMPPRTNQPAPPNPGE